MNERVAKGMDMDGFNKKWVKNVQRTADPGERLGSPLIIVSEQKLVRVSALQSLPRCSSPDINESDGQREAESASPDSGYDQQTTSPNSSKHTRF